MLGSSTDGRDFSRVEMVGRDLHGLMPLTAKNVGLELELGLVEVGWEPAMREGKGGREREGGK
jgi:hypothetical protein